MSMLKSPDYPLQPKESVASGGFKGTQNSGMACLDIFLVQLLLHMPSADNRNCFKCGNNLETLMSVIYIWKNMIMSTMCKFCNTASQFALS